jgi:hypothetical protein
MNPYTYLVESNTFYTLTYHIKLQMTEDIKNNEWKIIRIGKSNYDILNSRGRTCDTFNSVLSRIFEENKIIGIVTTDK